ncbi:MAG: methyltransferase [Proteobacteria bacterium]|jgi:tRNA1Val (adenine37-N6)-methyltransferase|nr:methyltransferase [Pseudomonadota bacterium]
MNNYENTKDKILNGSIEVIQPKLGYRFGFDAVFLSSFVNGFIEKKNKRKVTTADVGSGVGAISLILAFKNQNIKITAIENNIEYLNIAKENILNNLLDNKITLVNQSVFNIDHNLNEKFDLVVSNPPYHLTDSNFSKNNLKDISKRIVDLEKWLKNCIGLLKNKGYLFLIFPADILDKVLNFIKISSGSFKIFPFWPKQNSSAKRVILIAKKGGLGPTELMAGLKLYNNKGVLTKRAQLVSKKGIITF